ncbi:roadblock/LC7 domain-containing protein [Thermus thermamylovorans]|uniref:Roadblock/LC7 domain-containing protein n=1 Tax=Thermus thermamylovorans TaxID=2509362 RepID=A0A4Q9B2P9_9DEIN|nr:roadblock/LC7 domain-containing protein [Thermus thermamylovorans]TBH17559.1 roadblock/LC7 domain-containing protein [Thermus thermamylovorans]
MEEALRELKATRGVRVAALLSEDGFVVEEVRDEEAPQAALLSARAATVLGTAKALAQTLAQEGVEEVMVEYPEGALLLVPLPGHHLLLLLDGMGSLGRARLALKKVLPQVEEALS